MMLLALEVPFAEYGCCHSRVVPPHPPTPPPGTITTTVLLCSHDHHRDYPRPHLHRRPANVRLRTRAAAAGDIRDAADKAWCATLRATDALVLARTGQQPPTSPATTRAFLIIGEADPAVRRLQGRYFQRQSVLHGNCFYMGLCEPVETTTRLIRETEAYIRDTQALSEA